SKGHFDLIDHLMMAESWNRSLPRAINLIDIEEIGFIRNTAIATETIDCSTEAMGLVHHHKPPCTNGAADGLKHRFELGRMVAIIVQNQNTVRLPHFFTTAVHASESAQSFSHDGLVDAELQSEGKDRQSVQGIMPTYQRNFDIGIDFAFACGIE